MNFSHDKNLAEIANRVEAGERLSFEDGLALYATDDLSGLGKLADTVRRRRHGRITYFNVNRHLNPTNICYADCKFCGFYRAPAAGRLHAQHRQLAWPARQCGATIHIPWVGRSLWLLRLLSVSAAS